MPKPDQQFNNQVKRNAPKGPPADGRQDHAAMRVAAMLPTSGAGSTDALAAGGGLDVPGHEPEGAAHRAADLPRSASAPEPIPGAYERDTAIGREPGAIGAHFNGADAAPGDPHALMDEMTVREHRREGGGGEHHG